MVAGWGALLVLAGVWSAAFITELSSARFTFHVVTINRLLDVLWTIRAGALLHLTILYQLFKLLFQQFVTSVTKLKHTEAGTTKSPFANSAINLVILDDPLAPAVGRRALFHAGFFEHQKIPFLQYLVF